MPDEIATPAFVLRARAYGESDRIVTFITEQHGKVTGIAKGAKNSRRRFAGTLEPFVHVRVVFRLRPASDLAFLLRCELLEALWGLTTDLDRFAAGSYVLDLTDRMVLGRESGVDVYRVVRDALRLLAGGAEPDALLRAVEMHLLRASGWAPTLDHCRGCGIPADAPLYLVVERGGLLCRRCVPIGEPVHAVAPEIAVLLTRLGVEPLEQAAASGADSSAAARVTEELLASVTSGPVRSRGFLARTRVDSPIALR